MKTNSEKRNNARRRPVTYRVFALILCACMLIAGPYWPGTVLAEDYSQVKRWFPADSIREGAWGNPPTEDDRYEQNGVWNGLDRNLGQDNTGKVFWGKEVTADRDPEAYNKFTSSTDTNFKDVVDYLNGKYKYLGVYDTWRYLYPQVSWAYDASLSGSFDDGSGGSEVLHVFKVVTNDSFASSSNDNDLSLPYGTKLSLYLYFVVPSEGVEGVTDWMPRATADDKWIVAGQEGKEINNYRDSEALKNWDEEEPNTDSFVAWLNNAANGYSQLIVKVGNAWSMPYDVTWSYSETLSYIIGETKYYAFTADTGATVFYGADGAFDKGTSTPLKFYLLLPAVYVEPPETYNQVIWWGLVYPNGNVNWAGTEQSGVTSINTIDPSAFDGNPEDYIVRIKELYSGVRVKINWPAMEPTYAIKKITYDDVKSQQISNSTGQKVLAYKFTVKDNLYWADWVQGGVAKQEVEMYLMVYESEPPKSYQGAQKWTFAGASGDSEEYSTTVNLAEIKVLETDEEKEAYAQTLSGKYKTLDVWANNPDNYNNKGWITASITGITYDADKTSEIKRTASDPNEISAVYKVTVNDTFYWDNNRNVDGSNTVQFYIIVYANKPKERHNNIFGWRVFDPEGRNCGEITNNGDDGTMYTDKDVNGNEVKHYIHAEEYIHLASDIAFQNEPGTDEFEAEMNEYLANYINEKYTLQVCYDSNRKDDWKDIPIKSIEFAPAKTVEVNSEADRNYDKLRRVGMFKVETDDDFYWDGGGTPVIFYISVAEAAITRNPVTEQDNADEIVENHIVNDKNYPHTFGGPIIQQPAGVTVNLFDYWLEGTPNEPGSYDKAGKFVPGTGNLDTAPFYNWTHHNLKWETPRSENVFQSGINKGHLLLFGGGNRFRAWQTYSSDNPKTDVVGNWNFYTGDLTAAEGSDGGNMRGVGGPNYGIVQKTLDEDGYPALALNDAKWGGFNARTAPWSFFGADGSYYNGATWYANWPDFQDSSLYHKGTNDASKIGGPEDIAAWFNPNNPDSSHFSPIGEEKRYESLGYLFKPENGDYKKVYKDVRGMFRLDQDGYYYFNAPEELFDSSEEVRNLGRENVYAYLDQDQKTDGKGNKYYQMTLYDTAYGTQFFPFDEWGKSFEYDEKTGKVTKNRFEPSDSTADQVRIDSYANNLNHFFGMTLEAEFQQPLGGKVNGRDMVFQFSGDDDVWIFVDGVLVGDLGGVHSQSSIEINFSTGNIRIQDRRWSDWVKTHPNTSLKEWEQTNLYDKFHAADPNKYPSLAAIAAGSAKAPTGWHYDEETGKISFATNSMHDLKFFYMERGHEESNLSLSYNFPETRTDRIWKVSDDGGTLADKATFSIYKAYRTDGGSNKVPLDLSNPDSANGNGFAHKASEFTYNADDLIASNISDHDGQGYADLGTWTYDDSTGEWRLDTIAYDSYDTVFFVLKETTTPPGYRTSTDIVFQYDAASNTLVVVNKYETGSYTSYIAKWQGKILTSANAGMNFMEYDVDDTGERNKPFIQNEGTVGSAELDSGLTIIIPIIKQTDADNKAKWYPMYGSNTNGWHTITPDVGADGTVSHADFVDALSRAAVMQITVDATNTRDWYLTWNSEYRRMEGLLENMPGNASRFLNYNPDGDMSLVPLYLPEDMLEMLVGSDLDNVTDDEARFQLLKSALQRYLVKALNEDITDEDIDTDEKLAAEVMKVTDLDSALKVLTKYVNERSDLNRQYVKILDNSAESFDRQPRTVIYVPNEQRELRVRKVDPDGNYVNGAVFAIFTTAKAAAEFPTDFNSADAAMSALAGAAESYGQTATVTLDSGQTQDGLLIFREDDSPGDGYSQITWPPARSEQTGDDNDNVYWLREIYAPKGFRLNENLIRIEVGNTAIYANATGYEYDAETEEVTVAAAGTDDGITVRAALGKLAQPLVKFALDNNVDVTLRDISITKQVQNGGTNGSLISSGWGDATGDDAESFNLHYGMNSEELTGQYGRHSGAAALPFFVTGDGYIRVMPRQNLSFDVYDPDDHNSETRFDDLGDIDLDSLYGLMNVVVVEDERYGVPLEISKTVDSEDDFSEKEFGFDLSFTPAADLSGEYEAYIQRANGQQDAIIVYIDYNGGAWIKSESGSLSSINLKDGEKIVILGLPEGIGFTITEEDPSMTGYSFSSTIELEDNLNGEFNKNESERTITGRLNSTAHADQNGDIPSVKVHYINRYSRGSVLPESGSVSFTLYYALVALFLAFAIWQRYFRKRKSERKL